MVKREEEGKEDDQRNFTERMFGGKKTSKGWWVLFLVSLAVILPFAAPYVTFHSEASRVDISSSSWQFPLLVAHIVFALIALVSGFLQFVERIRVQKPLAHRYLGRVYVFSVFASALLALSLVIWIANFPKAIGFLVLSIIWLFTCWKGYRSAMNKRFDEHRLWMIRCFGITLVAVSGRILVPILLITYYALNGFSLPAGREGMIEAALNVNIWAGLIVNFVVIEWFVLRSKR